MYSSNILWSDDIVGMGCLANIYTFCFVLYLSITNFMLLCFFLCFIVYFGFVIGCEFFFGHKNRLKTTKKRKRNNILYFKSFFWPNSNIIFLFKTYQLLIITILITWFWIALLNLFWLLSLQYDFVLIFYLI